MDTESPALTTASENFPTVAPDQRASSRTRTVMRVARIRSSDDEGLARVRNISDGGMRLAIGIPVAAGDLLEVSLSDSVVLHGRVVWSASGECGLEFSETVDSNEALRIAAEEARLGKARAPRLAISLVAVLLSEHGLRVIRLRDISQRGMKIAHNGDLRPGLSVKIMVSPGVERRGVVRWVDNDLAGLILIEPFSVRELGSVNAL